MDSIEGDSIELLDNRYLITSGGSANSTLNLEYNEEVQDPSVKDVNDLIEQLKIENFNLKLHIYYLDKDRSPENLPTQYTTGVPQFKTLPENLKNNSIKSSIATQISPSISDKMVECLLLSSSKTPSSSVSTQKSPSTLDKNLDCSLLPKPSKKFSNFGCQVSECVLIESKTLEEIKLLKEENFQLRMEKEDLMKQDFMHQRTSPTVFHNGHSHDLLSLDVMQVSPLTDDSVEREIPSQPCVSDPASEHYIFKNQSQSLSIPQRASSEHTFSYQTTQTQSSSFANSECQTDESKSEFNKYKQKYIAMKEYSIKKDKAVQGLTEKLQFWKDRAASLQEELHNIQEHYQHALASPTESCLNSEQDLAVNEENRKLREFNSRLEHDLSNLETLFLQGCEHMNKLENAINFTKPKTNGDLHATLVDYKKQLLDATVQYEKLSIKLMDLTTLVERQASTIRDLENTIVELKKGDPIKEISHSQNVIPHSTENNFQALHMSRVLKQIDALQYLVQNHDREVLSILRQIAGESLHEKVSLHTPPVRDCQPLSTNQTVQTDLDVSGADYFVQVLDERLAAMESENSSLKRALKRISKLSVVLEKNIKHSIVFLEDFLNIPDVITKKNKQRIVRFQSDLETGIQLANDVKNVSTTSLNTSPEFASDDEHFHLIDRLYSDNKRLSHLVTCKNSELTQLTNHLTELSDALHSAQLEKGESERISKLMTQVEVLTRENDVIKEFLNRMKKKSTENGVPLIGASSHTLNDLRAFLTDLRIIVKTSTSRIQHRIDGDASMMSDIRLFKHLKIDSEKCQQILEECVTLLTKFKKIPHQESYPVISPSIEDVIHKQLAHTRKILDDTKAMQLICKQ